MDTRTSILSTWPLGVFDDEGDMFKLLLLFVFFSSHSMKVKEIVFKL